MKKTKNIILGIGIIIIGLVLAGNAVDLFDINLFFDGWWTLFIIVPCLYGIFSGDDEKGNIIGLIIGTMLLLACQGVFDFDMVWKLLLPTIIIAIGVSIVLKNTFDKDIKEEIDKLNKKIDKDNGYCSTFSSQNVKVEDEFTGTNLNAIFGGVDYNLRTAKIKKDAVINATCVFGGIDIHVPNDVIVKVKSNSIFGGVSCKKDTIDKKDAKIIYVNATCIFGGVDIK